MATRTVSVIMANYNGAAHIATALRSVLAQSLTDFEVIVTDDASTDDSLRIAQEFAARDPRVVVLTAPENRGPAAARNRALDVAQGDWIAIVDSDDLIHPERLALMVAAADDTDGVADDLICFFDDVPDKLAALLLGEAAPAEVMRLTPEDFVDSTALAPNLGYLKPLLRRSAIGDLRYREDIRIGEDHDYYMRFMLAGGRLHLLPQAYYLYRKHTKSLSHRLHPSDVWDMIRAQDELLAHCADASLRLVAKCTERRAGLVQTMAFESVVRAIKQRAFGAAFMGVLRRPDVLPKLVDVGLSRFRAASDVSDVARQSGSGGAFAVPQTPAQWAAVLASVSDRGVLKFDIKGSDAMADAKTTPLKTSNPLVHVRTPTYRRPEALKRCLESLIAQTHENWICDVYDDDPAGSAAQTVAAIGDPRVRFNQNAQQRFASKNIDLCFTRNNPHDAEFFFVLEDDNFVLPQFITDNIAKCVEHDVQIVLRNQLMEFQSGTDGAHLSKMGILDSKFNEGRYSDAVFRLCLMADIGVSNGGLFWSRHAVSDLEIHYDISATLQEYMRTFAIREPIYVAMEPLAVWAENGEETTRDLGNDAGYYKRELSLKNSIGVLQRKAWAMAPARDRRQFLTHPAFRYPVTKRAAGLIKSHTQMRVGASLGFRETLRLAIRGAAIRLLGRPEPKLGAFVAARAP